MTGHITGINRGVGDQVALDPRLVSKVRVQVVLTTEHSQAFTEFKSVVRLSEKVSSGFASCSHS